MKPKLRYAALKLFVFIAIILVACLSQAQQVDTAAVSVRHFNQQAIEKYKGQQEFVYETIAPENLDFFSLILHYLRQWFSELFSSNQQVTIYRILIYAFMIGSVLLIILNLLGIDLRRVLLREPQAAMAHTIAEENIREMNLDELIATAFANKQWRLGIRYQYLKALRLLTDRELIHWQPGKTNMDYYYELKNAEAKNAFLGVTNEFETAWYGNSEIDEGGYLAARQNFESFYGAIKRY